MNRVHIIQNLIDRYNFQSYLEIGVASGWTYRRINCPIKRGMDPELSVELEGVVQKTSHSFFMTNKDKFDIVFIDGLHLYEQVAQDIVNSLNSLNLGGFIIVHDCYPIKEEYANRIKPKEGPWNGDVYKAMIWFRETYYDYPSVTINEDEGLGVIKKTYDDTIKEVDVEKFSNVPYKYIETGKTLGLVSYKEFNTWLKEIV
jgi:hypothetical protein